MELHYPLILDGSTGTQLQKRGYDGGVCAEAWSIDHPEVVRDFQKEYLQYDSEYYIGFNKENDFYEHIPDKTVFANSDTFFPGTAYNLNFAIKKGDLHHGK